MDEEEKGLTFEVWYSFNILDLQRILTYDCFSLQLGPASMCKLF